jgi:hypothetical protein
MKFIINDIKYNYIETIAKQTINGKKYAVVNAKKDGTNRVVTKIVPVEVLQGKKAEKKVDPLIEKMKADLKHNEIIEAQNSFKVMNENETLKAGHWVINLSLEITFPTPLKIITVKDECTDSVKTKKDEKVIDIARRIEMKYLGEHYILVSNLKSKILQIKVAPFNKVLLENIPMKGTKLCYKLLGDIKNINVNDGECVLDYILYEAHQTGKFKKLTRYSLVQYFGEKCLTYGVTTKQIIDWAKYMGNISVHALNPFLKQFASHIEKKNDLSLCFIVNNNHCYPIVDKTMKKSIAEKKCLELQAILFKFNYDNYDYFSTVSDELIKGNASQKPVILIETHNLLEIVQKIGSETNQVVLNMKFDKSKVSMFQHPISNQVYVASQDFELRKKVCEDMLNETNIVDFTFKNMSWTQLATNYMNAKYGTWNKSEYSNDLISIIKDYKVSPYIAQVNRAFDEFSIEAFDICRCYTSILIDNEVDYNIFSIFDNITPFNKDDKLQAGEYYIDSNICMADNTIVLSRGWYPLVIVKYWLENNYITLDDIKYKIYASFSLKASTFKDFASTLFTNWRDASKFLVNSFVGELNKFTDTKSKGCVTDSLDVAVGSYLAEKEIGSFPAIYYVNNLYFLRIDQKTELNSGHIPIWRHIIVSAYAKLDKLYKTVVAPNTKVICYNTDCIKVLNPKEGINIPEIPNAGDIRIDTSLTIKGRSIADLPQHEQFIFNAPKWNIFTETTDNYEQMIQHISTNSCLVVGMGGCGKTEAIKRTITDKDICFTFTHKACENLKNRGINNVHIFDSFFALEKQFNKVKSFKGINNIYVDECMCVPSQWIKKLVSIKRQYPNIGFKLFGDSRQTEPIEANNKKFDYNYNPTIMSLCNFNRVEMMYKFTRYDKSLYDVVMYFDKHSELPSSCADKTEKKCFINLCFTNEKRHAINQECLQRFSLGKQIIKYNNVDLCIGMPVMCLWNNPTQGLINSRMFTLTEITKDGVKLDDVFVSKKDFTMKGKSAHFDYGFCVTVHKFQGSEITDDYCIYELYKMDKKLMNTALTRGKSLDKVHFKYIDKYFHTKTYKNEALQLSPAKPNMINGRIYLIKNDKGQAYVGSTQKTIEERFLEHQVQPVNKHMKTFMDTNPTIELLKEFIAIKEKKILEIEDEYINKLKDEYDLLNVKINIKLKQTGFDVSKQVEVKQAQYIFKKFKIECNDKQKFYRIQYTIDGKQTEKKIRFGRIAKEEAKRQIEEYQLELVKKYS